MFRVLAVIYRIIDHRLSFVLSFNHVFKSKKILLTNIKLFTEYYIKVLVTERTISRAII